MVTGFFLYPWGHFSSCTAWYAEGGLFQQNKFHVCDRVARLIKVERDCCCGICVVAIFDWYLYRVQYLAMRCPNYKRSHLSTKATFFCPQGDHCGEVQLYLKIPWNFKIIMYNLDVALLNLQFPFFFFRQKRLSKICLEQCWGRSSDVQKWLQQ